MQNPLTPQDVADICNQVEDAGDRLFKALREWADLREKRNEMKTRFQREREASRVSGKEKSDG